VSTSGRDVDADVIVAGAGPAGSAAAYHLARRGRTVLLLDRAAFPRDKSCGDGLTAPAVRLLDEMQVLAELEHPYRTKGVRVAMRGRGTRDFRYPRDIEGLVVPRMILDDAIRRRAVAAGAEFRPQTAVISAIRDSRGTVTGVRTSHDGMHRDLRAHVVIAADGAASRLRHEVLPETGEGYGFAIRGYIQNISRLTDQLELYMPLRDLTDRYLLPSYGWVFPVSASVANVGVGLFNRDTNENVRRLFERFLNDLKASDERLHEAELCGPLRGAPLRFDFAPERSHLAGLVFAGDAAGLVSPFTGEGISYALESGKLAAEAVDRAIARGHTADLREYETMLERRFAGYFEVGRHGARRYRLVWRLLESTFENEKPLFRLARRAVLFPEGVGDVQTNDVFDDVDRLVARGRVRVREDLLAVGEVLSVTVRRDWPFLARFTAVGHGNPGVPFRPASLLLLASYFGDPRRRALIDAAAAIELGYAAALAHLSVEDTDAAQPADGRANWGNMLSVMVGDYLLSQASNLTSSLPPDVTTRIARALSRVAAARALELRRRFVRRVSRREYVRGLVDKSATLFSLPCQLGAAIAGAGPEVVQALERYGERLGLAFALTDEILEVRGKASEFGHAVNPDLRHGGYSLPLLVTLGDRGRARQLRSLLVRRPLTDDEIARVRSIVAASPAVDVVAGLAERAAGEARLALESLPHDPVRTTLERLTHYAVTRQTT